MVPLQPVKSSMVEAVGYSPVDRVFAVRYAGAARVHHYRDVAAETAAKVTSAESIGRAINEHIRGKYDYTAITLGDEAAAEEQQAAEA